MDPQSAPLVPHSRPSLGVEEREAARRVLESGWIARGPESEAFETALSAFTGAAGAVALSSGTMALTLALRAAGIGTEDHVAIPSYACAAVLHAVRAAGARPLIADVDPESLSIDPRDLDRRQHPALRCLILVHPFGAPAVTGPFLERGLNVIEDCAQSLGARYRGRAIGTRGTIATLSLAATKVITCGGPGGAVFSTRPDLLDEVRDLAGHDESPGDRLRLNGLMGDLHAAIARAQLDKLERFLARRRAIAERYDEAIDALRLARPGVPPGSQPIAYRYLVKVRDARLAIHRLNERGVRARRPVLEPLHRIAGSPETYPGAEEAHARYISLPIYPDLTDEEVDRVVREVDRCLR